jgi:hypothetical protein
VKYLPLLALQLVHAYYTDGRCPDFELEPALATEQLLKNHRCVLKPLSDGLRVLMAVTDDDVPFIPLSAEVTFTFRLRLRNPDFALFTDLTAINQKLAPLYTDAGSNGDNPAQLTLTSRQAWSTEQFAVGQPVSAEQFTLSGRPLREVQPADFDLEAEADMAITHYDAVAKIITVDSAAAAAGDSFEITYPTMPPRARDVLAEVDLTYNGTWPDPADGPQVFQIAFNPKQARWSYYVVTDRPEAEFRIEDRATSPLLFSLGNQTDLNQQPDPTDEVARTLAAQYPTMQRFRFVSDEPVPCRQAARKSIQLRLDDQPVLETLPNPSLKNYAFLEISNNGSVEKEDALFQVINYFNHQFSITGG